MASVIDSLKQLYNTTALLVQSDHIVELIPNLQRESLCWWQEFQLQICTLNKNSHDSMNDSKSCIECMLPDPGRE